MSDPRRDMLPMHEVQHSFDVVLRGYDRNQVAETIERLEADFRIALADRDAAVTRSTDLAGQLSAMHGEIEALRRKAATAAAPTFENMSERISHMLRLADEEATDIRRSAEQDAQAVREQTAAEERAMQERHAAGQAEVERMIAEARQNAEQIASKTQVRADELVAKAQERVARLDAESQARRAKVEEDFDIAQRARRAEAARQDEERERVSIQAARQRIAAAEQHAAQLVAEAEAKAAAIREVRDELTARLLQARHVLGNLPDLADRAESSAQRPQHSADRSPSSGGRHMPEQRPQTAPLTARTPETETTTRQHARPEPAGSSPASRPSPGPVGPATAVQPAVSADQPTGPATRQTEQATTGARLPIPPRPSPSPAPAGATPGGSNPSVQGPPTQAIGQPAPSRH